MNKVEVKDGEDLEHQHISVCEGREMEDRKQVFIINESSGLLENCYKL